MAALGGGRLHLGVPHDHTRAFLMHGRAAVPAWLSGEQWGGHHAPGGPMGLAFEL